MEADSYATAERIMIEAELQALNKLRIHPSLYIVRTGVRPIRAGYGEVRLADLRTSSGVLPVAVKKLLSENELTDRRVAIRLVREMKIWVSLDHPNILPFLGFHLSNMYDEAVLISPWEERGSIIHYLRDSQPDPGERLRLLINTIDGLAYLHTRDTPICHGDLKGANILVTASKRAVLCDLGLAKVMDDGHTNLTTSSGFKGSFRWCSREILDGNVRNLASDMWAWGCCALEIMGSLIPYSRHTYDSLAIQSIMNGELPENLSSPHHRLAYLRGVVEPCWHLDPARRSTAVQVSNQLGGLYADLYTPGHDPPVTFRAPTLDETNAVVAGELLGLVHHMLQYKTECESLLFRRILLSTCIAYATSEATLDAIVTLCQGVCCRSISSRGTQHKLDIQLNTLAVLWDWVETNRSVRTNRRLLDRMYALVSAMTYPSQLEGRARELREMILVPRLVQLQQAAIQPRWSPVSSSSTRSRISSVSLSGMTSKVFALSLNAILGRQLRDVSTSDCVSFIADQPPDSYMSVQYFNTACDQLTDLAQLLVLQETSPRARAKQCGFLVETAVECRRLSNFAAASAIVSALSGPCIKGLKSTKEEVTKAIARQLRVLDSLFDSRESFAAYCAATNALRPDLPMIPVLHVNLRIIKDEYPNTPSHIRGSTLINFAKYRQLYETVQHILRHPSEPPPRWTKSDAQVEEQLSRISADVQLKSRLEELAKRYREAESRPVHAYVPDVWG